MRLLLTAERAAGVLFADAWDRSMGGIIWPHDTVPRQQWRIALCQTRPEWQACYELRPTRTEHLLHHINPTRYSQEHEAGPEGHRAVA